MRRLAITQLSVAFLFTWLAVVSWNQPYWVDLQKAHAFGISCTDALAGAHLTITGRCDIRADGLHVSPAVTLTQER